ncbi:MAG: hypothetical protein FWB87_16480, partial [Defluviitaleaceae bacterium]|nr:hypothetical protein [Defluviitaleaceae bacterium]MCL2264360.1 hypothetical protein [Defluviitaleaceae bacterium]
YPPLYPPITHPQNPAIPREWLENVERELAGIHSYAGAIAGTLAGEVDLNLSASDVAPYFWTTRFPFSIPFSYSRMIQSLWTTPQAPRFEFDFTGTILDAGRLSDRPSPPRVQENPVLAHSGMSGAVLVIDLRDFERIAVYARWGIFIAFAFGLLKSTNMFIRW